ncbi:MAG: hypothetical protein FJ304_07455 [Planctomycetes bacterium]|nr:hypothetical protein [Planctomycetota bacterium]
MFVRTVLTLAAVALLVAPASAQKEKKAELTDFRFWSAPKTPHARSFVPGLQAALELTPAQVAKLVAAREATVDDPELRKLPNKNDPNATADDIAKANAKRAAAIEKLFKEVDLILTKDQKALIEKINDGYAKVVSEVGADYQPKIAAAKGNADDTAALRKEQAEAIRTAFTKKLDALLTNDQMAAVKKAAEEEAKRAKANPDKPKPKK